MPSALDNKTDHKNRQVIIVATFACAFLAACGDTSSTSTTTTSAPAELAALQSDATSIDVSNDILLPPLEAAAPLLDSMAVDTDLPSAIVSIGEPAAKTGDRVGSSISVDAGGTTLATGVPGYDSEALEDSGAVLVRFRVGEQWWFDSLLTSDAVSENAQLGSTTAISDDGRTIVAGAPLDQHNGRDTGAVIVFERFGEGWQQTTELYSPAPERSGQFGRVIALQPDGNTLYVTEGLLAGKVHIFQRISSQWQYAQTLTTPDTTNNFGAALSAAADGLVAISAPSQSQPGQDKNTQGQIYLYRTENLALTLWQSLSPPQVNETVDSDWYGFGTAIALSADGSTLVVNGIEQSSSHNSETTLADAALQKSLVQALVYEPVRDGQWEQTSTLIPAGSHARDSYLSLAVSADGQRVLAGLNNNDWDHNQVSVMVKSADHWVRTTTLSNPAPVSATFGRSIAITADGTRMLVSAPDANEGKVYQWLGD